jgi:hypothetical protein
MPARGTGASKGKSVPTARDAGASPENAMGRRQGTDETTMVGKRLLAFCGNSPIFFRGKGCSG